MYSPTPAETIIHGGRIATLDRARPFVSALAIARGRVLAIGDLDRLAAHRTDATVMIDVQGRTVIPGLNDSHMHIVREGLTYNMELRWDGVPSLADALRMLRRQAERVRGYPHCRICHPLPPANPQDARRGVRQPGQDLRRR